METDSPVFNLFIFLNIRFHPLTTGCCFCIAGVIILLCCSALISGSEVAYFSLTPSRLKNSNLRKKTSKKLIVRLLSKPERLLATILVANNFVNIAIVILSALITSTLVNFSNAPVIGFVVQVVLITFLLLLFGEILPKIYATKKPLKFAGFMSYPLIIMDKLFFPVSFILIYATSIINKRLDKKKHKISIDELSEAIDITASGLKEEKKILKGIVTLGNTDVREIMKSRVDVIAMDIKTRFRELLNTIIDSGFSRIPVYDESFDNVRGVLYIKDLLPHIDKGESFRWQTLIRIPYFIPETKKINDLLKEFQKLKIHMAIVIDEYGGTSGIVTLEDIIEEIVGEIKDESDEENISYYKIDNNNYIFDGKISLNDFYKILEIEEDIFEDVKGDADTLAGLILELKGEIPAMHEEIKYKNYTYKIESVDKRRIKNIKLTISDTPEK